MVWKNNHHHYHRQVDVLLQLMFLVLNPDGNKHLAHLKPYRGKKPMYKVIIGLNDYDQPEAILALTKRIQANYNLKFIKMTKKGNDSFVSFQTYYLQNNKAVLYIEYSKMNMGGGSGFWIENIVTMCIYSRMAFDDLKGALEADISDM